MTSDDDLAGFYDVPENREPVGPGYRLWNVTINGSDVMRVAAVTAADAATTAGDRWREKNTNGVDRGEIESVDVRHARRPKPLFSCPRCRSTDVRAVMPSLERSTWKVAECFTCRWPEPEGGGAEDR